MHGESRIFRDRPIGERHVVRVNKASVESRDNFPRLNFAQWDWNFRWMDHGLWLAAGIENDTCFGNKVMDRTAFGIESHKRDIEHQKQKRKRVDR